MTIEQMRGQKINLFNCCATSKQETREANLAELLKKMQALRGKIAVLRQQCEEVKATINIKPKNQDTATNAANSKTQQSSRIQRLSEQEMLRKIVLLNQQNQWDK